MVRPEDAVNQLIEGFRTTTLIATAVRTGIFNGLQELPRSAEELANTCGLDPSALERFIRGLVLLDLVEEQTGSDSPIRRYGLTGAGRLLVSSDEGRCSHYALLCQQQYLSAWMNMESALRGTAVPFESAFGQSVWSYRREHPEADLLFNVWLHERSAQIADELAESLGLSAGVTVADIGGGVGVLLSQVLKHVPRSRGVLAEQHSVLLQAGRFLQDCAMGDRCDLIATDFFVSVPNDCDVYLLKSVLHDWGDEDCLRILKSLRDAIPVGGRLLVLEHVLPPRPQDDALTVWLDLMMMNITGGRERTRQEFESLLNRSRFNLVDVRSAPGGFSLFEAIQK